MNKLIQNGRIMFAAGIIGLGVLSILSKDFIVGRPPAWPANFNPNPGLAYGAATILILAALAIIGKQRGALASWVIAFLVLLLSVSRHLPEFMNDWVNTYKSMAIFGGALIIGCSFLKPDRTGLNKNLVLAGTIFLSAFFICSGYAHFKFIDFVIAFIPEYIPLRGFWAYFCGVCLFAGGIGILVPQTQRLAALLSGFMLLGWFLLLHIPRFIAHINDASDRMGLFESFAFCGIFFVLAGLFSSKKILPGK